MPNIVDNTAYLPLNDSRLAVVPGKLAEYGTPPGTSQESKIYFILKLCYTVGQKILFQIKKELIFEYRKVW